MRSKKLSPESFVVLAVLAAGLLVTGTRVVAQTEAVLHHFGGNAFDGTNPSSGVIFDTAGNLYGETAGGGSRQGGTVFELLPKAGGGWMEQILHNFDENGGGGETPHSGLIFDTSGNLYGTTGRGRWNFGKVFELSPKASGGWMETLVYSFNFGNVASLPSGVLFDSAGNLYGPADVDVYGPGALFELTPSPGGSWTETLLHNFDHISTYPNAGLIFDSAGHLYGTTRGGGIHGHGQGMVFELGRGADGNWTEFKVLHGFNANGTDGAVPYGGVILDSVGNLYGTTELGGAFGSGTVYELTPAGGGRWAETILYDFGKGTNSPNGSYPNSALVFDAAGNLYGTTLYGGANADCDGNIGCGTVFELSPTAGGGWTETVLHSFNNNRMDGYWPNGPLVLDATGNLYGTTNFGGRYLAGIVFEITP